ncbi:MAG: fimbrillin family protein [Bacteroidales bacterium]
MKKTFFFLGIALLLTACSSSDTEELVPGNNSEGMLQVNVSIDKLNSKSNNNTKSLTGVTDGFHTGPVMKTSLNDGSALGLIIIDHNKGGAYPGVAGEIWGNMKCQQTGGKWNMEDIFHLFNTQSRVFAYFPYVAELGKSYIKGNNRFKETEIPVNPGYTDYMMGDGVSGSLPTATKPMADLIMYHSLAMVSFTFQKKEMFNDKDWSKVQSITIKNIYKNGHRGTSNHTAIPTGTDKCDLRVARFLNSYLPADVNNAINATGAWAEWTGEECQFGTSIIGKIEDEKATPPLFHALVIPQDGLIPTVTEGAPYAAIKVDDVVYNIPLNLQKTTSGNGQTQNNWLNGRHYVYNLTYSNKVLSVSSVTVNQWQEGGSSDIEI